MPDEKCSILTKTYIDLFDQSKYCTCCVKGIYAYIVLSVVHLKDPTENWGCLIVDFDRVASRQVLQQSLSCA